MRVRLTKRWTIGGAVLLILAGGLLWFAANRRASVDDFSTGMQAVERGDFIAAADALERLRRHLAAGDRTRLLAGAIKLRRGMYGAALDEFVGMHPEGALREPALRWTGECLHSLGRWKDAESCFSQLVALNPDNADAYRWLAVISYDLGAVSRAIEYLNEVTRLAPQDFRPWRMMGSIHRDFEQFIEAAKEYRQALALQPDDDDRMEIIRELADVLMKRFEYRETLVVLASAPKETAELAAREGFCRRGLGEIDAAKTCLQRALDLDASQPVALQLAATLAMDEGKPREAADMYERILLNDPHNVECRYQRALALRELGDTSGYEVEIQRVAASRKLLEQLTALSTRAMEEPGNADLLEQMATLCDELGRHKLAEAWRRAVESANTPKPRT